MPTTLHEPATGTIGAPLAPVHRHPACDDSRWAHLPTRFAFVDAHGSRWNTYDTLAEAHQAQTQFTASENPITRRRFGDGSLIVEAPVAPAVRGYGDPRDALRGPWPGGTWAGRCGAMVWVDDTDGVLIQPYRVLTALARLDGTGSRASWEIPQPITCNQIASSSQVHHMLGNAVAPGFYYECQHQFRHLGPCGGVTMDGDPDPLGITWDPDLPLITPRHNPTLF